jgi:hypothetical protein
LLDEACFEKLVDDLNSLTIIISGKDDKGATKTKSFTLKSFPGDEFADEEVPTAVVAIYDHKAGYGGMSNLSKKVANVHWFSREFIADVEVRMHARELKKGSVMFHPRDITNSILTAVKKRVRASWDRILIDYYGSVIDDSLHAERDYQGFVQGATESMRLLRFQIRYEEHWTKLLDGETPEGGDIEAIEFGVKEAGGIDTPTTVKN